MIHQVRTIFLSDIHLGTRACQADRLLSFLRCYQSERMFLVGDIIDFWAMNRSIHWTAAQNTFVQKILKRARHGTEVIFVPGNHDEALRDYTGIRFGDIRMEREYVHTLADGRRFLIIHGDEYDQVTRHHRWVAILGDIAYNFLVILNGWLSRLRRLLNIPGYWSLAGYAKRQVKSAVSFIFDFEDSVVHGVQQRGLDGVICGHIHSATIRDHMGICYVNCGDWVDSCTAIVEHADGRLELIEWTGEAPEHQGAEDDLQPPAPPEPAMAPALEPAALGELVSRVVASGPLMSSGACHADMTPDAETAWLGVIPEFFSLPEPAVFSAARPLL